MMIGHHPPSNGIAMQFRYKYTRSYRDRHGKLRIEYRRNGRTMPLPSTPGTPEFQAAYDAAHTSVEMSRPATTTVRLRAGARDMALALHGVLQVIGLH